MTPTRIELARLREIGVGARGVALPALDHAAIVIGERVSRIEPDRLAEVRISLRSSGHKLTLACHGWACPSHPRVVAAQRRGCPRRQVYAACAGIPVFGAGA